MEPRWAPSFRSKLDKTFVPRILSFFITLREVPSQVEPVEFKIFGPDRLYSQVFLTSSYQRRNEQTIYLCLHFISSCGKSFICPFMKPFLLDFVWHEGFLLEMKQFSAFWGYHHALFSFICHSQMYLFITKKYPR